MDDVTPGKPLRVYASDGGWTDHSTDEFVGRGLHRLEGWLCAAGARNISIKPDGRVRAATCSGGGTLGNIFEDMSFPREWVVCPFQGCTCGADLFIPKVKSPAGRELLRKTQGLATDQEKRRSAAAPMAAMERVHQSAAKQVYWEISFRCNYNCSYCAPYVHNAVDKHRPFVDVMKATERILEDFARGEPVNFIISGGEPTLQPQFLDWVRLLSTLGHHVSVHSNGSRLPAYYKQLNRHCDLNLSLHFEFWKPERFFKVVEVLAKQKLERLNQGLGHLEVKIMMPPGGYRQAIEVEQRLRAFPGFNENCTASVVPIRVGEFLDAVNPEYSPEEVALFGARPG